MCGKLFFCGKIPLYLQPFFKPIFPQYKVIKFLLINALCLCKPILTVQMHCRFIDIYNEQAQILRIFPKSKFRRVPKHYPAQSLPQVFYIHTEPVYIKSFCICIFPFHKRFPLIGFT